MAGVGIEGIATYLGANPSMTMLLAPEWVQGNDSMIHGNRDLLCGDEDELMRQHVLKGGEQGHRPHTEARADCWAT